MKKEKGLSMIALIFIVIIVGFILFKGITFIKNYITEEKKDDIKTTMLLIQGKITEIANKHEVDSETNILVGLKLELTEENEEEVIEEDSEEEESEENSEEEKAEESEEQELKEDKIEYEISEELRNILLNIENAELYILRQEDLENMAIKNAKSDSKEFYIVDYTSRDVIYSLGIEGKYKLSDIEKKDENIDENNNIENVENETEENIVNEVV